jgi:hypothetical protein
VPDEWLTLVRGNPQTNASFDFCSETCLTQWLSGHSAPPQKDKPECKARRFLYINGRSKAAYEGVLFGDGAVFLYFGRGIIPQRYFCLNALVRDMADNDHIEWIDQERKA